MISSSASTTYAKRPISLSGTGMAISPRSRTKAKLIKKPSGIFQITPESLEALLIHKHIRQSLVCLRPALCGYRRGSFAHARRPRRSDALPYRAPRAWQACSPAASAFCHHRRPRAHGRPFLSQGTGRDCIIPRFEEPRRVWRISMEHFYNSGPQAQQQGIREHGSPQEAEVLFACERIEAAASAAPCPPAPKICVTADSLHRKNAVNVASRQGRSQRPSHFPRPPRAKSTSTSGRAGASQPHRHGARQRRPRYGLYFEHTRGRKCTVFCQLARGGRGRVFPCCAATAKVDTSPTVSNHHGNLSASLRGRPRELMRDEEQAQTTVTTSTLELGIDIGRLSVRFRSMRRLPSAPFCA